MAVKILDEHMKDSCEGWEFADVRRESMTTPWLGGCLVSGTITRAVSPSVPSRPKPGLPSLRGPETGLGRAGGTVDEVIVVTPPTRHHHERHSFLPIGTPSPRGSKVAPLGFSPNPKGGGLNQGRRFPAGPSSHYHADIPGCSCYQRRLGNKTCRPRTLGLWSTHG